MPTKQARFCHLCGRSLSGSYLMYDNGLIVCEQCSQTISHCDLCSIPTKNLIPARHLHVCQTCHQKLSICACCQQPILQRYFIIGDTPVRYCEDCVQNRPRCEICHVPINNQGKILSNGASQIYRCSSCYQQAVKTQKQAEEIYQEIWALLSQELALQIPLLPELQMVSREHLIRLHQQQTAGRAIELPGSSEQQHFLGFFRRINEERKIYIEQLLPEPLFRAVAAHELAHAWQSDYTPDNQQLVIIEGFAEWVAYRTLLKLGYQREAARLTRREDLYGQGLQLFIALERDHGRNAVFTRATQV